MSKTCKNIVKSAKKDAAKNPNTVNDNAKFYNIKGRTKILVLNNARKTINKKYYGRKLCSTKKYIVQRKLRKSIEVGKVAIILSGKHMGKRCIITKILQSGLLVVVGPYEINGVPLKRVDPRYLAVTSTNIFNFTGLDKIKDEFIKKTEDIDHNLFIKSLEIKRKQKKLLKNKNESLFINNVIEKIKEIRKEDPKIQKLEKMQKEIGNLLKIEIIKNKIFNAYLKSKFTLRNDMLLHKLKF